MRSRTASTTATVLVPDCLRMESTTAGVPSWIAAVSAILLAVLDARRRRARGATWPSRSAHAPGRRAPSGLVDAGRACAGSAAAGPASMRPPGRSGVLRVDGALHVDRGERRGAQLDRVDQTLIWRLRPPISVPGRRR